MPIIYIYRIKKKIYIYNVLINTLYNNTKKKKKLYIKHNKRKNKK